MRRKYVYALPDERGRTGKSVEVMADNPVEAVRNLKKRGLHPLELISIDGKNVKSKQNKGIIAAFFSLFTTKGKEG